MKYHEARYILNQAGYELIRQNGSHQIWKREQEMFVLSVHKGNKDANQILV